MSDSVTKYYDMMDNAREPRHTTHGNQAVNDILAILQAAKKAKLRGPLLKQVHKVAAKNPHMSPSTVFKIAADDLKICELSNIM